MAIPPEIIEIGVEFLNKFWENLIGGAPRGNLQKFSRTIYPVMAAQAAASKLDVYAFWFGQTVKVSPTGKVNVVAESGVISAAEEFWKQLEREGNSFFIFRCSPSVNWNSDSSINSGCDFHPVGPKAKEFNPSDIDPGKVDLPTPDPRFSSVGFFGIIALAVIIIFKKGKIF